MIDYVFRYDPRASRPARMPATPEEARRALVEGNRVFSKWMADCREAGPSQIDSEYIVQCGGLAAAFEATADEVPPHKPFAAVLSCADARVPTKMIFGRSINDLFMVRVAGNVLGDSVQGSMDYAIHALNKSVRLLAVIGHTDCGAVKGAVNAYCEPEVYWSNVDLPFLRLIFERIFVAVRESDNALREVWGTSAHEREEYRAALVSLAICLNAAHGAYMLRQQVQLAKQKHIDVVFGVYDVSSHQVCMPVFPGVAPDPAHVDLAPAPRNPREFSALATELARRLRPERSRAVDRNAKRRPPTTRAAR